MINGSCECPNGHQWTALVVDYGDQEGVRVSQSHCPDCGKIYQMCCTGYRLGDLYEYCEKYGDSIFVRGEQEDGSWDNVPYSKLRPDVQKGILKVWFERRHIPVRILSDEETKERKDESTREAAEEDQRQKS